jgi:hypothetical protein
LNGDLFVVEIRLVENKKGEDMSWSDPCSGCGNHRADCDCPRFDTVPKITSEQYHDAKLIVDGYLRDFDPSVGSKCWILRRIDDDFIFVLDDEELADAIFHNGGHIMFKGTNLQKNK